MQLSAYHRLIVSRIKPEVETLTGIDWGVPAFSQEAEDLYREYDTFGQFPRDPLYRYMVYLRHHGFPSPLLDWTRSPFVAAFFAFRDKLPQVVERSVYAFCETMDGVKASTSSQPSIRRTGPYVRAHKRHFLQQADYTICAVRQSDEWRYASHEEVFAPNTLEQDFLWKFNIPSAERGDVLKLLEEFNLNAYSLFGSEEALMETLSARML